MPRLPDFDLGDASVGGVHVLTPRGEIDGLTGPLLGRRLLGLLEEGKRFLVIDLSKATFLDSTGLGVLVNGLRQVYRRGGRLMIVCPTERVRRPFQIAGLHDRLPIASTVDEAIGSLSPA